MQIMRILSVSAMLGWLAGPTVLAGEADPAADQLFQAIRRGDPSALRAQIKTGVSVSNRDASGNTRLHLAALYGDAVAVASLLKAGAEVNAINKAGATPLLYGAHDEKVVRSLLKRAANPN